MDVLVTGATGYVGAAIADALLAAGHRVSGLARSEATSVRGASREVEPVVHGATTHGEDAEETGRTIVGAVLDAFEGTNRTFCLHQRCS